MKKLKPVIVNDRLLESETRLDTMYLFTLLILQSNKILFSSLAYYKHMFVFKTQEVRSFVKMNVWIVFPGTKNFTKYFTTSNSTTFRNGLISRLFKIK